MISLGGQAPHVLRAHIGHTCGEPDEIELTIRVLTGSFTALFIRPSLLDQNRSAVEQVSTVEANRVPVNPFLCTTPIHHVKRGYSTTRWREYHLTANRFAVEQVSNIQVVR